MLTRLNKLLEDEGLTEECDECRYLSVWTDRHPYGSTSAGESMTECICGDDKNCPRLEDQ